MFATKIVALLVLASWLGTTCERLYDCWRSEEAPRAHLEPTKSVGWSPSQVRW